MLEQLLILQIMPKGKWIVGCLGKNFMAKMKRCAKFQDRLLLKVCLTALIVCLNVILLMKRLPPILTQEVRCSKLGELTHEGRRQSNISGVDR